MAEECVGEWEQGQQCGASTIPESRPLECTDAKDALRPAPDGLGCIIDLRSRLSLL